MSGAVADCSLAQAAPPKQIGLMFSGRAKVCHQ
jgi:hypothetical protein